MKNRPEPTLKSVGSGRWIYQDMRSVSFPESVGGACGHILFAQAGFGKGDDEVGDKANRKIGQEQVAVNLNGFAVPFDKSVEKRDGGKESGDPGGVAEDQVGKKEQGAQNGDVAVDLHVAVFGKEENFQVKRLFCLSFRHGKHCLFPQSDGKAQGAACQCGDRRAENATAFAVQAVEPEGFRKVPKGKEDAHCDIEHGIFVQFAVLKHHDNTGQGQDRGGKGDPRETAESKAYDQGKRKEGDEGKPDAVIPGHIVAQKGFQLFFFGDILRRGIRHKAPEHEKDTGKGGEACAEIGKFLEITHVKSSPQRQKGIPESIFRTPLYEYYIIFASAFQALCGFFVKN